MALARWFMDGSRFAFWVTSVETLKDVPIVEGMPELGTQTQLTWEDQFVSGIETPVLGLVVSASALLLVLMMERRKKNLKVSKS
tara:strand:- start:3896 stop:4147 length:252 start_codon:yes stop_codon:yes gene_type:complete